MPMPVLMSAGQFKSKSGKLFATRKNPIILDIDRLLDLYARSGDNPRRQVKILFTLFIWCKKYLAGEGGSTGTRKGVPELLQQVQSALGSPAAAAAMRQTTAKGGATGGKALDAPYQFEPFMPGKGNIGGVQLQHQTKRVNLPAIKDPLENLLMEQEEMSIPAAMKEADVRLGRMSPRELIDLYHAATGTAAFAEAADFEYSTKQDREQYRVYVVNGRFCTDPDGGSAYVTARPSPNGTTKANDAFAMYAMSTDHRLYARHAELLQIGGFNHSSFLSGKPVMCAGMLETDGFGRLTSVSNESGHYKPNTGDLAHLLNYFWQECGVDLKQVTVTDTATKQVKVKAMTYLYTNIGAQRSRLDV